MTFSLKPIFEAILVTLILFFIACNTVKRPQSYESFDSFPIYQGTDLGMNFNSERPQYKLWAPTATMARLNFYESDSATELKESQSLDQKEKGVWEGSIKADLIGSYYTVQVKIDGVWNEEVPGPYAKAAGTNGLRAQLIDPTRSNPEGWAQDTYIGRVDPIIYELHIRDFSIHESSGLKNKGKYLAFTERGSQNGYGQQTGLDHIKAMGITHIHLLPCFDYLSVDESKLDESQFNWGYDPQNYNIPEGSYSSDPSDGVRRIREFKAMVKAIHDKDLGVVMDVVYNHTGKVNGLSFEETVPGYYYRQWEDGSLSNASGCGNEVASDRLMTRAFIVESLKYWVREYHIDGFRFDLMAIHDIETMLKIKEELMEINPNVLLYGEGWTASDSPFPEEKRALKRHTYKLGGIAAFSDEIRDGIKGSWANHEENGFVGGDPELKESVKFGIVGGVDHPQIDYSQVNNSDVAWAKEPSQCIAYVSCHDNHTLYDKLKLANPGATENQIEKMHLLSNAIVLTSQAIPFLHAGVEFLRTKDGVENSYKSPDSINAIDWNRMHGYENSVATYKNLIAIRKNHSAFSLNDSEEVRNRVVFFESHPNLISYTIDAPENDDWNKVLLVFNGSGGTVSMKVPEGSWNSVYVNSLENSSTRIHGGEELDIAPFSFNIYSF